ncbi:MAG: dTMP kinase [Treponema sp.]|nr:dTMP kinase [Treponema sp.]
MPTYNTDELKNRFIVIEGIDGAGTTTQVRLLGETLIARGFSCMVTAEPTMNHIGQLIRTILSGEDMVVPTTVAHLFAADRNEHLYGKNGIMESLKSGSLVISDRYVLSSLAYQGTTCGHRLPWLLNSAFPAPGLTLLFEVDPEICIARIRSRLKKEIYETLEFQRRVQTMYERMAYRLSNKGWRIERIDGSKDIESVQRQIESIVFAFLGFEC